MIRDLILSNEKQKHKYLMTEKPRMDALPFLDLVLITNQKMKQVIHLNLLRTRNKLFHTQFQQIRKF